MPGKGTAKIVGVYPVAGVKSCHLIEMQIESYRGTLHLVDISQPEKSGKTELEQAPYWARRLNDEGNAWEDLPPEPVKVKGALRLAFFFHYLRFDIPLSTPFGALEIPKVSPMPKRLSLMTYLPPD